MLTLRVLVHLGVHTVFLFHCWYFERNYSPVGGVGGGGGGGLQYKKDRGGRRHHTFRGYKPRSHDVPCRS